MQGTRLATLAINFQQFRFKRVRVDFIPAVPNVVGGMVMLVAQQDTAYPINNIDEIGSYVVQFSDVSPVREPCHISWSPANTQLWYSLRDFGEPENFLQGMVSMHLPQFPFSINGSAKENFFGVLGMLIIDYEIEFRVPALMQLEPNYSMLPTGVGGPGETFTLKCESAPDLKEIIIILPAGSTKITWKDVTFGDEGIYYGMCWVTAFNNGDFGSWFCTDGTGGSFGWGDMFYFMAYYGDVGVTQGMQMILFRSPPKATGGDNDGTWGNAAAHQLQWNTAPTTNNEMTLVFQAGYLGV
jgi:hypothetical protein